MGITVFVVVPHIQHNALTVRGYNGRLAVVNGRGRSPYDVRGDQFVAQGVFDLLYQISFQGILFNDRIDAFRGGFAV